MVESQGQVVNASTDKDGNTAVGGTKRGSGANTLEDPDQRLKDWVNALLPGTAVALSAPADQGAAPLVGLYLLDLHASPPAKGPRRSPQQIELGYLVTAWAPSPETSHSMLWALVFGAMEMAEFEVDLTPISSQLWQAFGVVPRPAFMLRLSLRRERPEEPVRLIKSAIELTASPMESMAGLLLGPHEIPIVNARVSLPGLRLTAHTDERGCFRFAAIPCTTAVQRFHIQARGREFMIEAHYRAGDLEPLIIHIDPEDV